MRDLSAHERRVCDPDGYQPASCARCGHRGLHVHCYRERRPRGDERTPAVVRIVQYICAGSGCGATWRILPMFLARHLWRAWETVERVSKPDERVVKSDDAPPLATVPVPERTMRRWRARLAASARVLVVLLAASGGVVLEDLSVRAGVDATRGELVTAHAALAGVAAGERLSTLAALVHRLERGSVSCDLGRCRGPGGSPGTGLILFVVHVTFCQVRTFWAIAVHRAASAALSGTVFPSGSYPGIGLSGQCRFVPRTTEMLQIGSP